MIAFLTSAMILQFWALIVFGGLVYWLPTIVAFARGSEGRFAILVVNLLLGWTLLGWIGALVWALVSTSGYRAPAPHV